MEIPEYDDDGDRARPGARDCRSWAGVWRWNATSRPGGLSWLLDVLGTCNKRISKLITDVPTTHATPLDMTFIQHFLGVSIPFRFPQRGGWTVDLSTHYLGGGRHWGDRPDWPRRWEIADIGLLVLFRQSGNLLRSKVALLQSKRLYPDELDWDEDSPID